MIRIEKKRLRMSLILGFAKENPTRTIITPITIIAFIAALCMPNKLSFTKINRIFEDKKGVMYYEMERGDVIESSKPLETFGKGSDTYMKTESFGEGKSAILFLATIFLSITVASFFVEDLKYQKIFRKAIITDLKRITIENSGSVEKKVWVAYSKEIGEGCFLIDSLYLPESMAELESMPDVIDKPEMRNRKLEDLGI